MKKFAFCVFMIIVAASIIAFADANAEVFMAQLINGIQY